MSEPYLIENVPLFVNLPPALLKPLQSAAIRNSYKSGEIIFRHGDLPEHLYIVEEGAVDILLPGKGDEIILASFEAGSFFGELAVFDKQPRIATARATMDTSLVC